MIHGQELRLGNWVNQAHATIKIVAIASSYCICEDDNGHKSRCTYPNVDPIPITPEILEKCGFTLYRNTYGYYITSGSYAIEFPCFDNKVMQCNVTLIESGFSTGGFEVPIQYVHQLQNLIQILTGKELEINL